MADEPRKNDGRFDTNFRRLEEIKNKIESREAGPDELIPLMEETIECAKVCMSWVQRVGDKAVEVDRVLAGIVAPAAPAAPQQPPS